jgi:hypothetical protein
MNNSFRDKWLRYLFLHIINRKNYAKDNQAPPFGTEGRNPGTGLSRIPEIAHQLCENGKPDAAIGRRL